MMPKHIENLSNASLAIFILVLILGTQSFSQVELPWRVVSPGGTDASSGVLRLRGTVGQTSTIASTAGTLDLNAGFWQNFAASGGCCVGVRGDVNGDGTHNSILDLNYMVNDIFRGGGPSPCPEEADINGDGNASTILDLNYLVNDIFRGGPSAGLCL